MLPAINFLNKKRSFYAIIPMCAENDIYINHLKKIIYENLPKSTHYFPQNYITNCSKSFLVSEIIREKLMRFLGKELPYTLNIKIKHFNIDNYGNYNILGIILVKHNSQKKIVIGTKGNKIKIISTQARQDIEVLLQKKVFLKINIK